MTKITQIIKEFGKVAASKMTDSSNKKYCLKSKNDFSLFLFVGMSVFPGVF